MSSRWIERGRAKRALDLALAIPALVLLSPVMVVVAALVRRHLGRPVLFRQERAGRDGKTIRVPKFRSMTDERSGDGDLLPDEQRVSSFGVKLRSTSLDELPQLWLVIKGDMSLVGPRPLPTRYVDRYSPEQRRRLRATPGITGWAQVNGRNASAWPERLANDVWYVDNASIWLDVKIIGLTVSAALRRDGVSAEGCVSMREFTGER